MNPEGRSFQPWKTSVKNSAYLNTLKMSPGSTNAAAWCQPWLLVAGKAKLFPISEWCRWRVGVDFISYVKHQGCQKGCGEAGGQQVQWCSWLTRNCMRAWPYSFSAKRDTPAFIKYWLAGKVTCVVMLSVGSLHNFPAKTRSGFKA